MSLETTDVDKLSGANGGDDSADGDTEDRRPRNRQVRTVGQQERDELDGNEEGDEMEEDLDEPSVIVQLANRVQDGTRCRIGSLDMCIQGKCQVSGTTTAV